MAHPQRNDDASGALPGYVCAHSPSPDFQPGDPRRVDHAQTAPDAGFKCSDWRRAHWLQRYARGVCDRHQSSDSQSRGQDCRNGSSAKPSQREILGTGVRQLQGVTRRISGFGVRTVYCPKINKPGAFLGKASTAFLSSFSTEIFVKSSFKVLFS